MLDLLINLFVFSGDCARLTVKINFKSCFFTSLRPCKRFFKAAIDYRSWVFLKDKICDKSMGLPPGSSKVWQEGETHCAKTSYRKSTVNISKSKRAKHLKISKIKYSKKFYKRHYAKTSSSAAASLTPQIG